MIKSVDVDRSQTWSLSYLLAALWSCLLLPNINDTMTVWRVSNQPVAWSDHQTATRMDLQISNMWQNRWVLGVGDLWGATTIFMILKISCQLRDRQTAWSGASNVNWGTKCVVIMINWSRCWNWWVMTSVSSVLTTNQQLNLVPFLPSRPAQTGVIDVIDGIEKMSKLNQFLLEMTNCWSMTDSRSGLGFVCVLARANPKWAKTFLLPWQHRHLLVVVCSCGVGGPTQL